MRVNSILEIKEGAAKEESMGPHQEIKDQAVQRDMTDHSILNLLWYVMRRRYFRVMAAPDLQLILERND
jgi:hypothetical protein